MRIGLLILLLLATSSPVLTLQPLLPQQLPADYHPSRYMEHLDKTQIYWNEEVPPEGWADITKEYRIIKFLAKGGFSEIYLIDDLRTGQENIVLKRLTKSFYNKPERWNDAEKEVAITLRLPNHENVCQAYRFFQDKDYLYITLENCGGLTLWTHYIGVRHATHRDMSEDEARPLYKQALRGLQALHTNSIYHLDFTPANMFFNPNTGILKIGDFGLSISTNELVYPKYGCPFYSSPERRLHNPLRPSAIDIWYAGVGIFVMTTGKYPFGETEDKEMQRKMENGIYEIPPHISPELRDLFERIFVRDDTRITLDEMINHPWFTKSS